MLVFALKPLMTGSFNELFQGTHARGVCVCVCVLVKEGGGELECKLWILKNFPLLVDFRFAREEEGEGAKKRSTM